MQTYEISVRGRVVKANSDDMTLVRTSVGIDRVHVLFDNAEWMDFPVTITFTSSSDSVTESLTLSRVGGDTWAAEAYCIIPWEVVDDLGVIYVTLQGTDSGGRHIITAKGSPMVVEEAGDVAIGSVPASAPTVDQWTQAYADAMAAVNEAQSVISELEDSLSQMVSAAKDDVDEYAQSRIDDIASQCMSPATTESLGLVQVGNGLVVVDGILNATGMSDMQYSQLGNLAALAYYCFDTSFDESGNLNDDAMVKPTALPTATPTTLGCVKPDGVSVTVDQDGLLRAVGGLSHWWDGTVLTIASSEGTSSADLKGPKGDTGEQGEQGPQGPIGPQGPAGYELTQEDESDIADMILQRMANGDGVSY